MKTSKLVVLAKVLFLKDKSRSRLLCLVICPAINDWLNVQPFMVVKCSTIYDWTFSKLIFEMLIFFTKYFQFVLVSPEAMKVLRPLS